MMSWATSAPALLIGAFLAVAPGVPIAWLLRLRGLTFWVGSVAASFVVFTLASIVSPLVGIRWGFLPILIFTVVLSAVVWLLRVLFPRVTAAPATNIQPRYSPVTHLIGFAIPALLIAYTLVRSIESPEAISQNYDTPFHLNAVAFILEHGSASPVDMTLAYPHNEHVVYPTLWHSYVALIVKLSGASIPLATHAATLIIAACVWPLSMLFVALPFLRGNRFAPIILGTLIPLFAMFPYRFLSWGLLYPNLLSTALVAITLGFLHRALQHQEVGHNASLFALWLAGFGALGATTAAHPNGLFAVAAIIAPLVITAVARNFSLSLSSPALITRTMLGAAFVVSVVVMWFVVQVSDTKRSEKESFVSAFRDGLTTSPLIETRMLVLEFLTVVGAVLLFKYRNHRWIIASYLISLTLFAISMGPNSAFRDAFTMAWYNDPHRIAALLPLTGIPLAAVAINELTTRLLATTDLKASAITQRTQKLTVLLMCVGLFAVFQGQLAPVLRANIHANFKLSKKSEFVTPDEQELMLRMAETTPPDALIASNPWNGSVFTYALTGRHLLFPYVKGGFGSEANRLAETFGDDETETCELVTELGVTHLFISDHPTYLERGEQEFAGFDGASGSPLLSEVDQEGKATLYMITGCDGKETP